MRCFGLGTVLPTQVVLVLWIEVPARKPDSSSCLRPVIAEIEKVAFAGFVTDFLKSFRKDNHLKVKLAEVLLNFLIIGVCIPPRCHGAAFWK